MAKQRIGDTELDIGLHGGLVVDATVSSLMVVGCSALAMACYVSENDKEESSGLGELKACSWP